jgi:hypothetical protein
MLTQMCALQGRIRVIPETVLIKQAHGEKSLPARVQNPDRAFAEYQRYRSALCKYIGQLEPTLTESELIRIVDHCFRLICPKPLFGSSLMLNRLRREIRKTLRRLRRVREFGRSHVKHEKSEQIEVSELAAESHEHSLAVVLVNSSDDKENASLKRVS